MSRIHKTLAVAAMVLGTSAALAGRPESIHLVQSVVGDNDEIYELHKVQCTDGTEHEITSWDDHRLWCVGSGAKDECSKKQIKIAQKVCK